MICKSHIISRHFPYLFLSESTSVEQLCLRMPTLRTSGILLILFSAVADKDA